MVRAISSRGYLRGLAVGTACMALALAVSLWSVVAQRDEVLSGIGRATDSITAPAFQLEREFLLLRHLLDRTANQNDPDERETLQLRFDIFQSRLALLRDSPDMAQLLQQAAYRIAVPKLQQWIARAEPIIAASTHDLKALAGLLRESEGLAIEVHNLSLEANSLSSHLLEAQSKNLLAQNTKIIQLTLAQCLLLLLAATALLIRHRRQVIDNAELEAIANNLRQAQSANQSALEKLEASQEELARSETRAALSTIIASVSHELSTPLGNSLMTASALTDQSREFQKSLDENRLKRTELANYVSSVAVGSDLLTRNLQRAAELLSNFRQVVNDQASQKRRSFGLATVIQEILATLQPSLKRHTHRVVTHIPEDIALDSYPGPLGQVVINLVNNAYLHGFEGKTHGTVTLSACVDGDKVWLLIKDDGVGMSEETRLHLFEPFFTSKANQGGTGLGLSIVANIVTKTLGGSIRVESALGAGTTWLIDFPLKAQEPTSANPQEPAAKI